MSSYIVFYPLVYLLYNKCAKHLQYWTEMYYVCLCADVFSCWDVWLISRNLGSNVHCFGLVATQIRADMNPNIIFAVVHFHIKKALQVRILLGNIPYCMAIEGSYTIQSDKFKSPLGNLEYLLQTHDHSLNLGHISDNFPHSSSRLDSH